MGEPTGFRDISRQPPPREATSDRVKHYNEFVLHWTEEEARKLRDEMEDGFKRRGYTYTVEPVGAGGRAEPPARAARREP